MAKNVIVGHFSKITSTVEPNKGLQGWILQRLLGLSGPDLPSPHQLHMQVVPVVVCATQEQREAKCPAQLVDTSLDK
jgi:hypothetical protein